MHLSRRLTSWLRSNGYATLTRKQLAPETAPEPWSSRLLNSLDRLMSLFSFGYEIEGPVAQRLEQGTHNPLVGGSNPSGPTTFCKN